MKFQKKEPFSVPTGNGSHWPRCPEMKYEAGGRVQCVHRDGLFHKGDCEFPKVQEAA